MKFDNIIPRVKFSIIEAIIEDMVIFDKKKSRVIG